MENRLAEIFSLHFSKGVAKYHALYHQDEMFALNLFIRLRNNLPYESKHIQF